MVGIGIENLSFYIFLRVLFRFYLKNLIIHEGNTKLMFKESVNLTQGRLNFISDFLGQNNLKS